MAEFFDALIILAVQHIDHIVHAKALTGAVDRRECLTASFSGVPSDRRCCAVIAIAAGLGHILAKIRQQQLATAIAGFTQAKHGLEFVMLYALELLVRIRVFHHLPQRDDIL